MNETERRARRADALRIVGAMVRNLDESGIMRLAYQLNYIPSQLANDIEALYDFVTEYAETENQTETE